MPQPRRADEPSGVLTLRISPEERDLLKQAARANFQTLSDFVRDVATNAASEQLEEQSDDEGATPEA
jgi:uncharacterized protein (DUF1778 family)